MRTVSEKENFMGMLLNKLGVRPRCGTHPIFEVLQECWATEGPYRPDARQVYRKIQSLTM